MATQITVLGTGQLGASIGLALAQKKDNIYRVGFDPNRLLAQRVEKLGAFDKMHFNLRAAVEKADVIILTLPVDLIRKVMEVVVEEMKPGSVLVDMSIIPNITAQWAKELLPEDRYFLALTPATNPAYFDESDVTVDATHADYYHNSVMLLSTPLGTHESAIRLGQDLSSLLGATVVFSEATEAAGLSVATTLIPELTAAALVNATIDQPGWRDARKMAGREYSHATDPLLDLPEVEALGQAALLNRELVIRMLDEYAEQIYTLRQHLAGNHEEEVKEYLEHAVNGRSLWLHQRRTQNWDVTPKAEGPSFGETMRRLFWFGGDKNKNS
ncbi:MAG TPA: prephenate dehydrogenase/arogenate dehydrogenase family protein [Anaerolineaceae bacterium]